MEEVKETLNKTDKISEKIKLLTMVPKNWSAHELELRFSVSHHMALTARKIHENHGIGSTPNLKPGKKLSFETDELVKSFYQNDQYSRMMPGKNDSKSVKTDLGRIRLQIRLLLLNLKELYLEFKKLHPGIKVGFSKFCELKPEQCIPVGGKGTHSVCVCKIHQNVKLMIAGARLKELTKDYENRSYLGNYKTILQKIICKNSTETCFSLECNKCPGVDSIKNTLEEVFNENYIDSITYKK